MQDIKLVHSFRLHGSFQYCCQVFDKGRTGRGLIQIYSLCYLDTKTILKLVDVARRQKNLNKRKISILLRFRCKPVIDTTKGTFFFWFSFKVFDSFFLSGLAGIVPIISRLLHISDCPQQSATQRRIINKTNTRNYLHTPGGSIKIMFFLHGGNINTLCSSHCFLVTQ